MSAAISALNTVAATGHGIDLPSIQEIVTSLPAGAVYFTIGFILACALPTLSRAGFAVSSLARLFTRRK